MCAKPKSLSRSKLKPDDRRRQSALKQHRRAQRAAKRVAPWLKEDTERLEACEPQALTRADLKSAHRRLLLAPGPDAESVERALALIYRCAHGATLLALLKQIHGPVQRHALCPLLGRLLEASSRERGPILSALARLDAEGACAIVERLFWKHDQATQRACLRVLRRHGGRAELLVVRGFLSRAHELKPSMIELLEQAERDLRARIEEIPAEAGALTLSPGRAGGLSQVDQEHAESELSQRDAIEAMFRRAEQGEVLSRRERSSWYELQNAPRPVGVRVRAALIWGMGRRWLIVSALAALTALSPLGWVSLLAALVAALLSIEWWQASRDAEQSEVLAEAQVCAAYISPASKRASLTEGRVAFTCENGTRHQLTQPLGRASARLTSTPRERRPILWSEAHQRALIPERFGLLHVGGRGELELKGAWRLGVMSTACVFAVLRLVAVDLMVLASGSAWGVESILIGACVALPVMLYMYRRASRG